MTPLHVSAPRPRPSSPPGCGQLVAKRALEIAAAGGHNLLFVGPPGCGKTMLARRLPSILSPMTPDEALEVTKIYSVAGLLGNRSGIVNARPFRFPHHTISQTALVGGVSNAPRREKYRLLARILPPDENALRPKAWEEKKRERCQSCLVLVGLAEGRANGV